MGGTLAHKNGMSLYASRGQTFGGEVDFQSLLTMSKLLSSKSTDSLIL